MINHTISTDDITVLVQKLRVVSVSARSYPANTHKMVMSLLQGTLLCCSNVVLLLLTLALPTLAGELDVHELQSSIEP